MVTSSSYMRTFICHVESSGTDTAVREARENIRASLAFVFQEDNH